MLSVLIWQQTVIGALLPWTCTRDAGQHLYLASRSAVDQLAVRRNLSGSSDPQMRFKEDERDLSGIVGRFGHSGEQDKGGYGHLITPSAFSAHADLVPTPITDTSYFLY
jgi:hypothetical protein